MAKWTFSEYSQLPTDSEGNPLQIASKANRLAKTGSAAAGTFSLQGGTRFVRFCGDTNAHVEIGSAADTTCDFVPAGQEYWIATLGAPQLTFIVG